MQVGIGLLRKVFVVALASWIIWSFCGGKALLLLGCIYVPSPSVFPILQWGLGEDRFTSMVAVNAMVQRGIESIPTLVETLDSENLQARRSAADALDRITKWDPLATKHLAVFENAQIVKALEQKDLVVQSIMVRVYWRMHEDIQPVLPILLRAASERDEEVRYHALTTFHQLGSRAKGALPSLEQLAKHKDQRIQMFATEAIQAINNVQVDALK